MLVESDCFLDPQAYIMRPDVAFKIAGEIIKTDDAFSRTVNTARLALNIIEGAWNSGELKIDEREVKWFGHLNAQLDEIPDDEERFIAEMKKELGDEKFTASEYGI
jgi:methanol--5-hydroxybenzimidazolylcobamide Co-methyltransferase